MSPSRIIIFNSDHDLALANNDASFVPPHSAAFFSRDCASIMRFLDDPSPIVVWGWDKAVRHRLLRDGADARELPSDADLERVRDLSHRRMSIRCADFLMGGRANPLWCQTSAREAFSVEDARALVEEYGDTIIKSPWSSSGKGLRPVRRDSWTASDLGWCEKIIAKQGSVIVERRKVVARDFSYQFRVEPSDVHFYGFSLFKTSHGAYTGNLLASNENMLSILSSYIDSGFVMEVKDGVAEFLRREFCGKYTGTIGVDMFIDSLGTLTPCVELNVRNNMGLIARNYFDWHIAPSDSGKYEMAVLYSPDNDDLSRQICESRELLTDFSPQSHYAVVCRDARR